MGASVSSRPVLSMRVLDRETGEPVSEMVPGYLRSIYLIMYQNPIGRQIIRTSCIRGSLARATHRHGLKMDSPLSVSAIPEFVNTYGVQAHEAELQLSEYKTFNDFFSRRLKPGVRPIASPSDPCVLVSPADCRILVYPSITDTQQFWLKGSPLSIPALLGPSLSDLAPLYLSSAVVICRLAPQDYHRWHLPISGIVGPVTTVPGCYYSVSPRAVRNCNILAQNKRVVCQFESKEFGSMLLISIGAAMVSSIVLMDDMIEGRQVNKGDMHGMFRFGGSTLVLLFASAVCVEFDDDLLRNSRAGMETLLRCGTQIGVKHGHKHTPHQQTGEPINISQTRHITDADTGHVETVAINADMPMAYDSIIDTIMHPLENETDIAAEAEAIRRSPAIAPKSTPASPFLTSTATNTATATATSTSMRSSASTSTSTSTFSPSTATCTSTSSPVRKKDV